MEFINIDNFWRINFFTDVSNWALSYYSLNKLHIVKETLVC